MSAARINPQIFALMAVSLLAHVTMSGGRVAATLFVLKHGYPDVLAGVAYSLYSLLPALLAMWVGRWIDQIGPLRVMRISQVMMITGLALPVLWPTLPSVLISAALCGFGFANYMLAANVSVALMAVRDESDRVGLLGWLALGGSVSAVVGPSMVGLAIDNAGFRQAYALLATMVIASLVVSFLVQLPHGRREGPPPTGQTGVWRMVLDDPRLLRIYLLGMTVSLSWDGFVFMIPIIGEARGYNATQIGAILSAFAIGTFTIRVVLPALTRHLREWQLLVLAFGLTAIVFLSLPLVSVYWLQAALGFAFGLAAGVGQPAIINLIYRAMPAGRAGEGAGLRAMMGNMVGSTAPSFFGMISGAFGPLPVFVGIGCVMSIATWQARRAMKAASA